MNIKPTDFEDTYKFSQNAFQGLSEKQGFELYQEYRDALLGLFFNDSEGAKKYSRQMFEESDIVQLNLIDQRYIDNFILCVVLRLSAPAGYDELKKIVDKNIRPDKRSEGWAHIYKEMSGALVLFLSNYENVTVRQADLISSQLFGVAQNFPKSRYLEQKKKYKLVEKQLPDTYTLFLLFFCLQKQSTPIENLQAIVPENTRSKKELRAAIQGYVRFKKRVFDNYISVAETLLDVEEKTILYSDLNEEFELNFILEKNYPENPSEYEVFVVIYIALGMELMPNLMYEPEKFLNFLAAET